MTGFPVIGVDRGAHCGAFLVLALATAPITAWGGDTWSTPYAGVEYLYRTTSTPNRIYVVRVDLGCSSNRVEATRSGQRGRTVSSFANAVDADIAVNGDFFSFSDYSTSGLAMGAGAAWSDTEDTSSSGFVAVGTDNRAAISRPGDVVGSPEDWMSEIVSGHPLIVRDGEAQDPACGSLCTDRHPRTAVGLSMDEQVLILAVVDGRSSRSAGMTIPELGNLMVDVGAHTALNLDGGGSSTMYIGAEGGVVNAPSDGSQRSVANHIGIAVSATDREVCDGWDNDCDGSIDEGVVNACGQCGPEPVEVCNCADDDCDGAIDDGEGSCPYVARAVEASHPARIAAGGVAEAWATFVNEGTETWDPGEVVLRVVGERTDLGDADRWDAHDVPARLEDQVAPGQSARIGFVLAPPAGAPPGQRTLALRLEHGGGGGALRDPCEGTGVVELSLEVLAADPGAGDPGFVESAGGPSGAVGLGGACSMSGSGGPSGGLLTLFVVTAALLRRGRWRLARRRSD